MSREHPPVWEIYKKEMDIHGRGDALWKPTTIPDIGDVGYISEGEFCLLFSAGSPLGERQLGVDVPHTFEVLEVGPPVSVERPAGCLHSPTVRKFGECRDEDTYRGFTRLTSLERGTNFSFDLTGVRGAALVTTGETHQQDSPGALKPQLKRYAKRHHKSWRQFAREKLGGDDVWPVLVTGFDVTRDFAMVAYSNEGAPPNRLPSHTSMSNSPPFLREWKWYGQHPSSTNYGPQNTGGVPTEFNQRVFIRYYTMRPRSVPVFLKEIPNKVRVGAGPRDLGSGDNRGETSLEPTVQPDAKPRTSGDADLGGQPGSITEGTGSEPGTAVQGTPLTEEYDCWDAVADYVFQNSDAESALMHHQDLMEIRAAGDSDDISSLLAIKRPDIVVDESGVGRIICEENKPSTKPVTTPPHLPTSVSPQFHEERTTSGPLSRLSTPSPRCVKSSQEGPQEVATQTLKRTQSSSLALQWLNGLGRSSPDFHGQLCNIPKTEEYVQCVPGLQDSEVIPLIDYLDKAVVTVCAG